MRPLQTDPDFGRGNEGKLHLQNVPLQLRDNSFGRDGETSETCSRGQE